MDEESREDDFPEPTPPDWHVWRWPWWVLLFVGIVVAVLTLPGVIIVHAG